MNRIVLQKTYFTMLRPLRILSAVVSLVTSVARARTTEIWIGDSHAIFLNRRFVPDRISRAPGGHLVLWLGPRLMWSIAARGFPTIVGHTARFVRTFSRAPHFLPIFVLGEIDVRCHLGSLVSAGTLDISFVREYLSRVEQVRNMMGVPIAVVVVPVPPGADDLNDADYPVRGGLRDRVQAFDELRMELQVSAEQFGGTIRVVDCTKELVDSSGQLLPELTNDGCHVNRDGRRKIRAEFDELTSTFA